MVKSLCFLLIWLLSLPTLAQHRLIEDDKLNGIIPLDAEGKPGYQLSNHVAGATKDELIQRARTWFVRTYNAPKDVLQLSDLSRGLFMGQGSHKTTFSFEGHRWQGQVTHMLRLKLKAGKYRITLTDLKVEGRPLQLYLLPGLAASQVNYRVFYKFIDSHNQELLSSLEKALATAGDH